MSRRERLGCRRESVAVRRRLYDGTSIVSSKNRPPPCQGFRMEIHRSGKCLLTSVEKRGTSSRSERRPTIARRTVGRRCACPTLACANRAFSRRKCVYEFRSDLFRNEPAVSKDATGSPGGVSRLSATYGRTKYHFSLAARPFPARCRRHRAGKEGTKTGREAALSSCQRQQPTVACHGVGRQFSPVFQWFFSVYEPRARNE